MEIRGSETSAEATSKPVVSRARAFALLTDLHAGYSSRIFQRRLEHQLEKARSSGLHDLDALPGRWELAKKLVHDEVFERYGCCADEPLASVLEPLLKSFPDLADQVAQLYEALRLKRPLVEAEQKVEETASLCDTASTADTDSDTEPCTSRASLSKRRALALQAELLAAFTAPQFQKRAHEISRDHKGQLDSAHRAALRKLVRREQFQIIHRYGFDASEEGVQDMLAAFRELGEDPDVYVNSAAIKEALFGPAKAPSLQKDLCKLDTRDSKEFVTKLLRKQLVAFSHPQMQRRVAEMQAKAPEHEGGGYFHLPGRHEAAMAVHKRLLPRFGFEGSRQGVQAMILHCAKYIGDPEVASLLDGINSKLGMTEAACQRFRRNVGSLAQPVSHA
eukprot:TRINITY_DN47692_c0_g1_i1.p1 TRINITY_DN47692_c0_g1~~TRINITY_DN47692_c0_g1_i1.p1  ORF type:complete len:391 (+),score=93.73 TRINITY_DN47692_c0_g1_i1:93-1265(+)